MVCPNCEELFTGEFLCVNVPNDGTLEYGVQFLDLTAGPNEGQTTVSYRICNCNDSPGTGISHINFELCSGGILPVQAIAIDEENNQTIATIDPEGDAIFGVDNFKVENFGDVDSLECITMQLIYNATFTEDDLEEGLFGVKIGGGPTSEETTGSVTGLLIPCVTVACTEFVTTNICAQGNVSITPNVTANTPVIQCINEPLINQSCGDIEGFTPIDQTGSCTFAVSQVICVTIPLDFSANATATSSGGACGPVVPGTTCPSVQ